MHSVFSSTLREICLIVGCLVEDLILLHSWRVLHSLTDGSLSWHRIGVAKFVEIDLDDKNFIGLPFVLRSGGNWYKDNGSDYYVPVRLADKKVLKVATLMDNTLWQIPQLFLQLWGHNCISLLHRRNSLTLKSCMYVFFLLKLVLL